MIIYVVGLRLIHITRLIGYFSNDHKSDKIINNLPFQLRPVTYLFVSVDLICLVLYLKKIILSTITQYFGYAVFTECP